MWRDPGKILPPKMNNEGRLWRMAAMKTPGLPSSCQRSESTNRQNTFAHVFVAPRDCDVTVVALSLDNALNAVRDEVATRLEGMSSARFLKETSRCAHQTESHARVALCDAI